MSKERFECEHNWIIDNNKRKTNESLIVYDEEWNTLDDLCELLNQQDQRIAELEEQLKKFTEPKKVKFNKFNGYRGTRFRCPNCNKQMENCIDYTADYYCKHCGQSVIYPKFRVVNNVGELYFEEATIKLKELQGD